MRKPSPQRLQNLVRRKEAELERLRHRTLTLQAEQLLVRDKSYLGTQKQIADLRHRLWQVRLNIKRKSYSIRVRKKALEQLEASLLTFQQEEQQDIAKLQQLDNQLKALHEKYMRELGATTAT